MKDYHYKFRVQNGRLRETIDARYSSIAEMCRKANLNPTTVGNYLNFRTSPMKDSGEWKASALNLASAIGIPAEDLWPDNLKGKMEKNTIEGFASNAALINQEYDQFKLTDGQPLDLPDTPDTGEILEKMMASLTPREANVLKLRFYQDMTLEEISKIEKVSRARIQQIETKALRKMRHPTRIRRLHGLLGDVQYCRLFDIFYGKKD
jgi:transcriptional regulator with XRE-family HTH domain